MGHGVVGTITLSDLIAFGAFVYRGEINVVGDFPGVGEAEVTYVYEVKSSLTDPVTGLSFSAGDIIGWNGSTWMLLGGSVTGTGLRAVGPVVIAPATTADIDVVATNKRFAQYHLLIDQAAAPKLTKITVDMVSDGTAPTHSVPSDIGDIQNIETITVLDTGFIRLKITNNEANSITVSGKVIE